MGKKQSNLIVIRSGEKSSTFADIYHYFLTLEWSYFFTYYFLFFAVFNFIFALIYYANPGSLSGTDSSLWKCFSFSVQTFSTVGYGAFSPGSDVGHLIAIIESSLSVVLTALLTGLIFAKFSRPQAHIVFSKNILVTQFDGKKSVLFRIANIRTNEINEARLGAVALKSITTAEGEKIWRQFDLKLVRDRSLFFSLAWTAIHHVDESSPLYNYDLDRIKDEDLEIAVSLMGHDSSYTQTINSSHRYKSGDFIFDRYFEDLYEEKDEVLTIHFEKIHQLRP